METTTGMSAPPMGMIRVIPTRRARAKIAQKAQSAAPPLSTSTTIMATMARPIAIFSRCRAGRMIGAPLMLPFSLAKAITEPVKVTAPMARPSDSSISDCMWMAPSAPRMP